MATYAMRETDQNPQVVEMLVEMYRECPGEVAPIVVVDGWILDGHHRNAAAQVVGVTPQAVSLTETQYKTLRAAGYDDMEIAAAAHLTLSDGRGADALDAQFRGANLMDRALSAAEMMER